MSFEKFEKVGGWTLPSHSLVGGPRHRVWSSEHGGVELSGVARSLVCVWVESWTVDLPRTVWSAWRVSSGGPKGTL